MAKKVEAEQKKIEKKNDMIYISSTKGDDLNKKYRFVELIYDQENILLENNDNPNNPPIKPKKVVDKTLYLAEGGQQRITCSVYVDKKVMSVNGIHIARRVHQGYGIVDQQEIYLDLPAVIKLRGFIDELAVMDFNNPEAQVIPLKDIFPRNPDFKKIKLTEADFKEMIAQNSDSRNEFALLLEISKRKSAYKKLNNITTTPNYKNDKEIINFIKDNTWLMNNEYLFFANHSGLSYASIIESLPSSFEGDVDIIEVRLPSDAIFEADEGKNIFPSSVLTKAVAKLQKILFEVEMENYKGEPLKSIKPRGSILIGDDHLLNSKEKQYLKILNSSYHNIKIITYNDLLDTAKSSIQFLESSMAKKSEE